MPITVELERPDPSQPFSRADLEFRGVDHSGPSYEARIFFDNPSANESTPAEVDQGYAGSFHVFGHGGCFGELGHCDVTLGGRGVYDRRLPHPLTPLFKTFTVTVAAVVPEQPGVNGDPLRFESVSLITFQDPSAAGIPLPHERTLA